MNTVSVFDVMDRSVRVTPISELNGGLTSRTLIGTRSLTSLGLGIRLSKNFRCRDVANGEFTIAFRGLSARPMPPCRGSPGSAASYWLAQALPNRTLLLVQYLPPHSVTSTHSHVAETEQFFPLAGHSLLRLGARTPSRPLHATRQQTLLLALSIENGRLHRGVTVPPRTVHQLETEDSPALNLILITGTSAQTLSGLRHTYAQWI